MRVHMQVGGGKKSINYKIITIACRAWIHRKEETGSIKKYVCQWCKKLTIEIARKLIKVKHLDACVTYLNFVPNPTIILLLRTFLAAREMMQSRLN